MATESLRFDGKLHFQPVLVDFLLVTRPAHQLIAMVIEAIPVNNRQIGRLQFLFHQIQNGQLKIFTVNRHTVRPDENQAAPLFQRPLGLLDAFDQIRRMDPQIQRLGFQ